MEVLGDVGGLAATNAVALAVSNPGLVRAYRNAPRLAPRVGVQEERRRVASDGGEAVACGGEGEFGGPGGGSGGAVGGCLVGAHLIAVAGDEGVDKKETVEGDLRNIVFAESGDGGVGVSFGFPAGYFELRFQVAAFSDAEGVGDCDVIAFLGA